MDGKVILNDEGQELRKGDVWHIKVNGSAYPKVIKILELTHHTVRIMEMPFSYIQPWHTLVNMKFLSKVNGAE